MASYARLTDIVRHGETITAGTVAERQDFTAPTGSDFEDGVVPPEFEGADTPAHYMHPDLARDWLPCPAEVEQRWTYALDGKGKGSFSPPEPSAPRAPIVVSDRQFSQQAAVDKLITPDEALAWVSAGTIPKTLDDLVAKLPADQQFPARMKLAGSTTFNRLDPTTITLTDLFGWGDAERAAFWTAAGAL